MAVSGCTECPHAIRAAEVAGYAFHAHVCTCADFVSHMLQAILAPGGQENIVS